MTMTIFVTFCVLGDAENVGFGRFFAKPVIFRAQIKRLFASLAPLFCNAPTPAAQNSHFLSKHCKK